MIISGADILVARDYLMARDVGHRWDAGEIGGCALSACTWSRQRPEMIQYVIHGPGPPKLGCLALAFCLRVVVSTG